MNNAISEWQLYAALQTYRRAAHMPETSDRQYDAKAAELEYCNRQIHRVAQTTTWAQLENLVVNVLPPLPKDFAQRLGLYLRPRVAEMTHNEALHLATYLPGHRNNAFTQAFHCLDRMAA